MTNQLLYYYAYLVLHFFCPICILLELITVDYKVLISLSVMSPVFTLLTILQLHLN